MIIWLAIFLFMSLAINILLVRAYIRLSQDSKDWYEVYQDFERLNGNIGKTLKKHEKVFTKKKGARNASRNSR